MSELEPTRTYSNLTATDVLRRLLDERGVEWWQSANTLGCIFTRWHSPIFGDEVVAMENGEEGLVLFDHFVTPEQAIAATLGSCNCSNNCTNGERTETCHMEQTGHVKVAGVDYYDDDYECSECGAEIFEGYNFCPMCGRRIEQ